ncbi:hypothetical protein C1A50_0528 [Paenibacillus polymyxa]|nr:hypothetical protein C1A50_0528 [Paenibacillus polymyxa]
MLRGYFIRRRNGEDYTGVKQKLFMSNRFESRVDVKKIPCKKEMLSMN